MILGGKMSKVTIVDTTVICTSFPLTPEIEIRKDSIIDTIKRTFDSGIELIVVEGEEGIGKTNILSQFARKYSGKVTTIFLKSTSKLAYDPDIHRIDLCRQLNYLVFGDENIDVNSVNDAYLRRLIFELQKHARKNNSPIYFIMDGIDDIPDYEQNIYDIFITMFPYGASHYFFFLFSGEYEKIKSKISARIKSKPFILAPFSIDETKNYFSDFKLSDDVLNVVHQTCRGVVGKLSSVKRILLSGFTADDLISDFDNKAPDLLEIEWRKVDCCSMIQINILAMAAFSHRALTISDYSRLLKLDEQIVCSEISKLSFLHINSSDNVLQFVSEPYRRFVATKVYAYKDSVTELLISDLICEPSSDMAVSYLPSLYAESNRLDDLLSLLSSDHLVLVAQKSQSLNPLLQNTGLGIKAAKELQRDGDLLKFSLQKSAVEEIDGSEIWRSEIDARMSLNEYDSALALAQSTTLIEDRLHALAVIAKAKAEKGFSEEPELNSQIRQLVDKIDTENLGERAVEIASDLIYSNPDLAMELVEKSTGKHKSERTLDYAIARLSIATLEKSNEQDPSEAIDKLHTKVSDPLVDEFLTGVSLLVGDYSSAKVIAEAAKISSTSDRIFLLKQWAVVNYRSQDAYDVVNFALSEIFRSTEYAPNAQDFRELATPLPFISDLDKVQSLINDIDSQKGNIERIGPTEDYVRMELLIARAAVKISPEAAELRLVDMYIYSSYIEDIVMKSTCLANIYNTLTKIDPDRKFEIVHKLHKSTQDELCVNIKELLATTAEQYRSTKSIINALANTQPEIVIDLCKSLNTEMRRDYAYLEFAKSIVKYDDTPDICLIKRISSSIKNTNVKSSVTIELFDKMSKVKTQNIEFLKSILCFIETISDIPITSERCRTYCNAYKYLYLHDPNYNELRQSLLQKIVTSWEAIDVDWLKIDIGFKIVKKLSEHDLEAANGMFDKVINFRSKILVDSAVVAQVYVTGIKLLIRAYAGLLPRHIDSDDDFTVIETMINKISSSGERAGLWTELALKLYIHDRYDKFKRVVTQYIKPLIEKVSDKDTTYKNRIIIIASPALYCLHKSSADEIINKLCIQERDAAYERIIWFLLRKVSLSEPYDTSGKIIYKLTYEEIDDIIEVMKKMIYDDSSLYSIINRLCETLSSKRYKKLNVQQFTKLVSSLENLIISRFPGRYHILHDGYKIISLAHIFRLKQAPLRDFLQLAEDARKIPNVSDKALVLSSVAVSIRYLDKASSNDILDEVYLMVMSLPSLYDKIDRLEAVADLTVDVDMSICKKFTKSAFEISRAINQDEAYPRQRRLIDIAYRLDRNYANVLTDMLDDDPARNMHKQNLKDHIDVLRIKNELGNTTSNNTDINDVQKYADAAWMLLGALNANKARTVHFSNLRHYIQAASKLPITESYPIYSYVIENAIHRVSNTDDATKILRPLFDATQRCVEISALLVKRSSCNLDKAISQSMTTADNSIIIKPGQRDKAIQYISKWIEHEAKTYLKICDPYFCLEDLGLLLIVQSLAPNIRIEILTSLFQQRQEKVEQPFSEAYKKHWRTHVSNQQPPFSKIVIVGTEKSGESPIHDRWWVTDNAGLRVGTSFNSIGLSKESDISILTKEESNVRQVDIEQYLNMMAYEHKGERLIYELFNL